MLTEAPPRQARHPDGQPAPASRGSRRSKPRETQRCNLLQPLRVTPPPRRPSQPVCEGKPPAAGKTPHPRKNPANGEKPGAKVFFKNPPATRRIGLPCLCFFPDQGSPAGRMGRPPAAGLGEAGPRTSRGSWLEDFAGKPARAPRLEGFRPTTGRGLGEDVWLAGSAANTAAGRRLGHGSPATGARRSEQAATAGGIRRYRASGHKEAS